MWPSADSGLLQIEVIDSLQLLLEAEGVPAASFFQCLEELCMNGCQGTQVELDLVRWVITSSRRLRRMYIKMADILDSREGFKFLKEVTRYKRASTEAEVICVLNEEDEAS
ncbi:unnamed protein product [Linum tenue]|uniref:Uncharacterized protein n=1 Tax=Linum tenue TaxID=586396 RepID=A0AAV0R6H7_9ROSI|nr:unnamed protein product [Linum tenue]